MAPCQVPKAKQRLHIQGLRQHTCARDGAGGGSCKASLSCLMAPMLGVSRPSFGCFHAPIQASTHTSPSLLSGDHDVHAPSIINQTSQPSAAENRSWQYFHTARAVTVGNTYRPHPNRAPAPCTHGLYVAPCLPTCALTAAEGAPGTDRATSSCIRPSCPSLSWLALRLESSCTPQEGFLLMGLFVCQHSHLPTPHAFAATVELLHSVQDFIPALLQRIGDSTVKQRSSGVAESYVMPSSNSNSTTWRSKHTA